MLKAVRRRFAAAPSPEIPFTPLRHLIHHTDIRRTHKTLHQTQCATVQSNATHSPGPAIKTLEKGHNRRRHSIRQQRCQQDKGLRQFKLSLCKNNKYTKFKRSDVRSKQNGYCYMG